MSVTDATDPVQAILDLLDATDDADYTNAGTKPTRIIDSGAYSPSEKNAYEAGDALYVYQSGTEGITPAGTDTYTEEYRVSIDLWTLGGRDHARALARDIQLILDGYWDDNTQTTPWVTVRPAMVTDYRHETFEPFEQHDRLLIEVRLMRLDGV